MTHRGVAVVLRRLPVEILGEGSEAVDAGDVIDALGLEVEDVWLTSDSVDELADLIDRPTCSVEGAERWETAGCGRGVDYELSCGHAVTLGECDELRFCPVCGAEVIKDEGIRE